MNFAWSGSERSIKSAYSSRRSSSSGFSQIALNTCSMLMVVSSMLVSRLLSTRGISGRLSRGCGESTREIAALRWRIPVPGCLCLVQFQFVLLGSRVGDGIFDRQVARCGAGNVDLATLCAILQDRDLITDILVILKQRLDGIIAAGTASLIDQARHHRRIV